MPLYNKNPESNLETSRKSPSAEAVVEPPATETDEKPSENISYNVEESHSSFLRQIKTHRKEFEDMLKATSERLVQLRAEASVSQESEKTIKQIEDRIRKETSLESEIQRVLVKIRQFEEFFEKYLAEKLVRRVRREAGDGSCLTEEINIATCESKIETQDEVSHIKERHVIEAIEKLKYAIEAYSPGREDAYTPLKLEDTEHVCTFESKENVTVKAHSPVEFAAESYHEEKMEYATENSAERKTECAKETIHEEKMKHAAEACPVQKRECAIEVTLEQNVKRAKEAGPEGEMKDVKENCSTLRQYHTRSETYVQPNVGSDTYDSPSKKSFVPYVSPEMGTTEKAANIPQRVSTETEDDQTFQRLSVAVEAAKDFQIVEYTGETANISNSVADEAESSRSMRDEVESACVFNHRRIEVGGIHQTTEAVAASQGLCRLGDEVATSHVPGGLTGAEAFAHVPQMIEDVFQKIDVVLQRVDEASQRIQAAAQQLAHFSGQWPMVIRQQELHPKLDDDDDPQGLEP